MNARCRVAVLVLSLSVSFAAWAQSGEHWVSTWAASPQQRVTFPPGAQMMSDAVDFEVPKLGDVLVSLYLPSETGTPTTHATGLHTTYISKEGNFSSEPVITDGAITQSWYFLASLDVLAPADA